MSMCAVIFLFIVTFFRLYVPQTAFASVNISEYLKMLNFFLWDITLEKSYTQRCINYILARGVYRNKTLNGIPANFDAPAQFFVLTILLRPSVRLRLYWWRTSLRTHHWQVDRNVCDDYFYLNTRLPLIVYYIYVR